MMTLTLQPFSRVLMGVSATVGILAAPVVTRVAHAQSPSHIYELNGSYNDTLGGPALSAGTSTLATDGVTFPANSLLSLSGGFASPDTYSIEMYFRLDRLTSFNKIIDVKNRTADSGLYVLNSSLSFYGGSNTNGVVNAGMNHLVLTRDGATNRVSGYLNGDSTPVISFINATIANLTGPDNIVYFFTDDSSTARESSSGFVDYIRTYDSALTGAQVASAYSQNVGGVTVPEPSTLVLFGSTPLLTIGVVLHRRRKSV
jgi:hypothetical protein